MSATFYFVLLFAIHFSECKSIIENNDTAIETLNNCKCVPSHQCYNGTFNIDGIGILELRQNAIDQTEKKYLPCSKSSYICCRDFSAEDRSITTKTSTPENKKRKEQCGKQTPSFNIRILTKKDDLRTAIDGEFPWMTSIFKKNELENKFQFKCAGSLIHDKVVMSAAHCFHGSRKSPSSFKIRANAKKELGSIGDDADQEREVEKIIVHPDYYAGGAHNDLALVILRKNFKERRELSNVCLPQVDVKYDSTRCIATGWGVRGGEISPEKKILRKVELSLIDSKKCEQLLRISVLGNQFSLHNSSVCAGGEKDRDTCKGDGGGPLICPTEEEVYIQVGIVSWGVDCARENYPGVYTDVSKFTEWIKKNLEEISP